MLLKELMDAFLAEDLLFQDGHGVDPQAGLGQPSRSAVHETGLGRDDEPHPVILVGTVLIKVVCHETPAVAVSSLPRVDVEVRHRQVFGGIRLSPWPSKWGCGCGTPAA